MTPAVALAGAAAIPFIVAAVAVIAYLVADARRSGESARQDEPDEPGDDFWNGV